MGLDRKPANFTEGTWKTSDGVERAYRAITEGVPGSAMPAWTALSEDDRWALVAFLMSVSERRPTGASP